MTLWSDGKTSEEIQKLSEVDGNSVAYNLHEDLLCVKEDLAKANERVRELEQANLELAANVEACCELTDMDMGAAIERLFEIDNTESKALLNKFAIEKKQEAILTIKDKWIKKASEMPPQLECRSKGYSCYNWAMFYARELTDEAEQLRKEQE